MITESNNDLYDKPLSIIQTYLEKYDWKYEVIESDTILTGFSSENEAFTMFIRCYNEVAYFSIPCYSDVPNNIGTDKGYKFLLDANYHMILTKFALDETGRIALLVELPIKLLTYDSFINTLYLLATNAVDQVNAVHDAFTNPNFESPYNLPPK
jgi:hypothetical protein